MKKLNLGCGGLFLKGFINMDIHFMEMPVKGYDVVSEWDWLKGIPQKDNSVDAVTCSCTLYNFTLEEYPYVLGEVFRVLKKGGVFRITEEDNDIPEELKAGYHLPWMGKEARSLTRFEDIKKALEQVGFKDVKRVDKKTTRWKDDSLIQDWHKPGCHTYGEIVNGYEKYFDMEATK